MLPIMRIVFLFISLSISLHATVSKAEPSTHIRTLMDRPFSMLDWGMYSVQNFLNDNTDWVEKDKKFFTVRYDWVPDEIRIIATDFSRKFDTYELAEQECKIYLDKVDAILMIKEGKDVVANFHYYGTFFTHNGWETESMDNAAKNISDRTLILIRFYSHSCSRKLMAPKFSVTKSR